MSTKIVLLVGLFIFIISCFKQVFLSNSSIISINTCTDCEKIRELLDQVNNVTRVRTKAELRAKGNELATLDFIGLVQQYNGYKAEEYDVQTEDGYILKMHRISSSPLSPESSNKPVIYMQHSLVSSSDIFVILGPDHDLAFMLADAGYDVWLGNVRGTTYSKRHVKYSSASTNYDFWNFNLDDIAMKDIPMLIDTVLEKTNATKINYIGYSMGNTLNYMLLSSKLEYNDKINLSISLAPAVYFEEPYTKHLNKSLTQFQTAIPLLRSLRFYELLPLSKLYVMFAKLVCKNFYGKTFCGKFFAELLNFENVDLNTISSIFTILFNGASLDVGVHYSQLVTSKKFRKFDFGSRLNQKKYNASEPPEYDLSKVTAPQAIFYADHDTYIHPKGAEKLKKQLPNVIAFVKVPKSYKHIDFIWAKDASIDYYYKIINLLKKF